MWHLRQGLKSNGEVVVVDADRPPKRHGIPPRLLQCELAAVGLKLTRYEPIAGGEAYFTSSPDCGAQSGAPPDQPCKA
jgi:hypothetical protein